MHTQPCMEALGFHLLMRILLLEKKLASKLLSKLFASTGVHAGQHVPPVVEIGDATRRRPRRRRDHVLVRSVDASFFAPPGPQKSVTSAQSPCPPRHAVFAAAVTGVQTFR